MPGKRSLYQRVLATPGSRLYPEPEASAASKAVIPFTGYYVYQRKDVSGAEWIQAGPDSHGTVLGWIPAQQVIPWNQALTVAFKDPRKGERVLLFRDRSSLKRLVEAYDLKTYEHLYQEAVSGKPSADSPVVAIQPSAHIDIQESFYLVPIKQHQDVYLGSEKARLLEVASVPLSRAGTPPRSYRSGIVFVIDTTQSMRPYIDRTREVVRRIFEAIDKAGLRDKVSFGLTAFRDTLGEDRESSYLSRTFVTLKEGGDPDNFLRQVKAVQAAVISNQDFIEDAFAGIKSAIDGNDWSPFDARYLILVTDASARTAEDPFSSTKLDSKSLRQLAARQGIAILTLHLRTAMGTEDHAQAEQQYRELSYYPGIGDFYYEVKMGEVGEFERVLEALTRQVTEQVEAATKGEPLIPVAQAQPTPRSELASLREKVAKLGYALQMRYLQKTKGAPPAVFDAWLVDRDFRNPSQSSIEVRVLLTRDQLSDLRNVLGQVLDLAEEGVLSPRNFLDELKRLAAMLSRDPASVRGNPKGSGTNLAELGYMREYLEDLPYTSDVMSLSLEDWAHWSAKEQLEFIHRLESKINYYQTLHDHTDLWISLGGGPVTGDSVFPVLLEMLP